MTGGQEPQLLNNLGANLHEEAFRLCPVTGSATRMHGVWTADFDSASGRPAFCLGRFTDAPTANLVAAHETDEWHIVIEALVQWPGSCTASAR